MTRPRLFIVLAAIALSFVACRGTAESTVDPVDGGDTGIDTGNPARDVRVDPTDGGAEPTADTRPAVEEMGSDGGVAVPDAADTGPDLGTPASAGCVDGSGLPEGENTFMLEGRERRFIVRMPTGYTGERPWPLVFALHGNGGSAGYWDGTSGDRDIRGVLQNEAILVVAEAIEGNWRDYNADPSTWPARIESELLYFDELITMATDELCVNEEAIFSMGFSGGGSFSGVLGCRRTDIRAIAVGGSVIYFDEANCVGTPAAWVTIGTEELTDGREAYRDFFRDRAGCDATSQATDPDPCVAYDGCDAATPVHYCQHPDGHIWPDFGSEAMWSFFNQFVDSP